MTRAVQTALAGAGGVLQVVQAVKNDTQTTTSSSFVDISGLSATITPTSTSSKILILLDIKTGSGLQDYVVLTMQRSIGGGAYSQVYGGTGSYPSSGEHYTTSGDAEGYYSLTYFGATYLDSPATTSAITYKMQYKTPDSGTVHINRTGATPDGYASTSASSITLLEIAG